MTNRDRIRKYNENATASPAHSVFWQLFDRGIKTQSAMAKTIGDKGGCR